jgi:hypothetical protein
MPPELYVSKNYSGNKVIGGTVVKGVVKEK